MDNMYSIKIWRNEYSWNPETRHGMCYGLAYALATNAGFFKVQIIDEDFNTIILETRNP